MIIVDLKTVKVLSTGNSQFIHENETHIMANIKGTKTDILSNINLLVPVFPWSTGSV